MDTKKTVGIGVGGALTAAALATCPLQIALLGALGALGLLPFLESLSPILYLVAASFGVVAVTGGLRLWRQHRTEASVES